MPLAPRRSARVRDSWNRVIGRVFCAGERLQSRRSAHPQAAPSSSHTPSTSHVTPRDAGRAAAESAARGLALEVFEFSKGGLRRIEDAALVGVGGLVENDFVEPETVGVEHDAGQSVNRLPGGEGTEREERAP